MIAFRFLAGIGGSSPLAVSVVAYHVAYVPDKEQRLLGVKFRTIEETAKDTLDEFKARGWLP